MTGGINGTKVGGGGPAFLQQSKRWKRDNTTVISRMTQCRASIGFRPEPLWGTEPGPKGPRPASVFVPQFQVSLGQFLSQLAWSHHIPLCSLKRRIILPNGILAIPTDRKSLERKCQTGSFKPGSEHRQAETCKIRAAWPSLDLLPLRSRKTGLNALGPPNQTLDPLLQRLCFRSEPRARA